MFLEDETCVVNPHGLFKGEKQVLIVVKTNVLMSFLGLTTEKKLVSVHPSIEVETSNV